MIYIPRVIVTPLTLSLFLLLPGIGCSLIGVTYPPDVSEQAFTELRSKVQAVIADPNSAEAANNVVGQLEREFIAVRNLRLEHYRTIRLINADYGADNQAFFRLLNEYDRNVEAKTWQISALHRQLLELTTSEQWARLRKPRNRAMDAAIHSSLQDPRDGLYQNIKLARSRIKALLPKSADRKAALAILDQMSRRIRRWERHAKHAAWIVQQVVRDPPQDLTVLDVIWDEYHLARSALHRDLIDYRLALRDSLDEQQWEVVFPFE
jgi:hypothetical protein